MQAEGTKLIFVMNFNVLLFSKFALNCTDFSLHFQNFTGVEGSMRPDPPRNFLFFFISNSRLCGDDEVCLFVGCLTP